jgi:hypothetical protein
MDAQELYDEIKAALKYFGLRFSEMDKVQIELQEGRMVLRYGVYAISLEAQKDNT